MESPRLMKMFFGVALKGGESETMDEVNADMVHLTQACLVNPKSEARCEIQVKETEGDSFTIAVLQKGATEALGLDLTFSPADPPTFVNKGKEEVHLTGSYEFYDTEEPESDEEDEEGSEAGEATDMNAALHKELERMIKEKAKQQGMEVEDSDDEDDDEEEEGDEMVEELEEEEEEEEEEEKPSPKKVAESPKKAASPKKVAESPKKPSPKKTTEAAKPEDKKRKLSVDDEASSPKAAKPAKAAKKGGNKVEDDYAKSIVEYLTKNGRTNVGQLGSKLRKPASVSKLSNFIKSRSEFKLSSGFIELA